MTESARLSSSRDGATASTNLTRDLCLAALVAAGVALHATIAPGAPLDVSSGFTAMLPSRTVQIVVGAAGVECDFTVNGVGMDGEATSEVIHATAGGGTFAGTKAMRSITSLKTTINPGDNVDLQTGAGFGIAAEGLASIDLLSVNGVVEVPTSKNAATGTVIPATAPNGARHFFVRYTAAHDHGAEASV